MISAAVSSSRRPVEIPIRVHARHFGGFAANQSAACLAAARRHAGDDLRSRLLVQAAGREVIQEEKRLRALSQNVVHAHRHKVDAHAGQTRALDGGFQLRADAVRARDQHRILIAGGLQVERAAKTAQIAGRAWAPRAVRQRTDQVDQPLARVDVDACILVAEALVWRVRRHSAVILAF